MNNQYQQNNNQVNYTGQPSQPMQYNYQQPKKKNIALILGLSIVGLFILGIIAMFIIFSIEEKQDVPWKSGQVQILNKTIQLPCSINDFESTLNTNIIDRETSDYIKDVEINIGYSSPLLLRVYIENEMVTGIIIDAYTSDADEYDRIMEENERYIAEEVIFPGNVTIETDINKVKELYNTKPFNSSYTYSDEEIGDEDPYISARHHYQNGEWEITIHTKDDEIREISYGYNYK